MSQHNKILVLISIVEPVHEDNPQALVSGLSYIQLDNFIPLIIPVYTICTYISVDLAHHEIFHAKVVKGGINLHSCMVPKIK